jgi:hypothetical protein
MLRKFISLLLVVLLLGTTGMAFAEGETTENIVTGDQITLLKMAGNNQATILVINIANAAGVMENPVRLVLIKTEDMLPFADAMGDALQVSVMKLTRDAAEGTLGRNEHITGPTSYSDGYTEEVAVINTFFDLKRQLANRITEYATLSSLYQFDMYANSADATALMSPEVYESYKRWSELKTEIINLRSQLSAARNAYLRLFETYVEGDEIKTPSYYKDLGVLPAGTYSIRLLNSENRLIRAFDLTITGGNIEMIAPKGLN